MLTEWLLKLSWNYLFIPVGVWFLRGVWVASTRPRIKYVEHTVLSEQLTLFRVVRQERLPPWRALEETWLLDTRYGRATRESDGKMVDRSNDMYRSLFGHEEMQRAKAQEIEQLTKLANDPSSAPKAN